MADEARFREQGRRAGIEAAHCHVLSIGGMMLDQLREQNPDKRFIPVSRLPVCRYMKMITLPKLRDTLRDLAPEVRVPPHVPIERMVAIS